MKKIKHYIKMQIYNIKVYNIINVTLNENTNYIDMLLILIAYYRFLLLIIINKLNK